MYIVWVKMGVTEEKSSSSSCQKKYTFFVLIYPTWDLKNFNIKQGMLEFRF